MRIGLLLSAALLLSACGVKSEQAPADYAGYLKVANQLHGQERAAFGTWWNGRAEKVKRGTATDADFNLTVGQAIERAAVYAQEHADKLAHERECVARMMEEARNSKASYVPSKC